MSTYFTDFSADTIGVLPSGWVGTSCNAVVSAEGLAITRTDRFATMYYSSLSASGVTEVYCQFKTSSFTASSLGFGSSLGELDMFDSSNVSALTSSSGSTDATRVRIYEGATNRASVNITAAPAAGSVFNTLLQLSTPAVAGVAYTAKAWFWANGATPKTSADTPDITYSGTFAHTHTAQPGFGIDITTVPTLVLLKFGVGTAGDQAPQSGAAPPVPTTAKRTSLTLGLHLGI